MQTQDIYRFRKQRGVNLGSWFVLERWITDRPFRHAAPPAKSDLDVANGRDAASILNEHYASWITDLDFAWLASRGFTTVRIPIGYYHLCGVDASVIAGTDFAQFTEVFRGAWARLVAAIETAGRFGLGVLIDLHAAPGKQNDDAHSGTSHPAAFFTDRKHRVHTIHVLRTLVTHLKAHAPPLVNIIGIELLNEPHPSSDADLKTWFSAAIKDLAAVDPSLPIYLSDCWKTEQYAEYIKTTASQTHNLLALDHHLYRCFTSDDISTPASAHAHTLTDPNATTPRLFARIAETLDEVGAGLVIGEWSGALNPGSLTGSENETANYVAAQLQLFETHCAGHFFWTYKKQHGPDRGWSLRDAIEGGVYPSKLGLWPTTSVNGDQARRTHARNALSDKAYGMTLFFAPASLW
ncbi:glycoside hydrolase [Roridomyces roridus]|uniref:Glycoside hydrolase n=1 Tax=Roridomyces roridus TaxID=1738132 RepID=A0AAD7FJF9_9AGAR|nr:glycoside hydrolase [Roridomyces roridus]